MRRFTPLVSIGQVHQFVEGGRVTCPALTKQISKVADFLGHVRILSHFCNCASTPVRRGREDQPSGPPCTASLTEVRDSADDGYSRHSGKVIMFAFDPEVSVITPAEHVHRKYMGA